MRKVIPQQNIFICDFCHQENPRHIMSGKISIDRGGLDWAGNVVGPGGFSLDACDKCVIEIEELIRRQICVIQKSSEG